LYTPNSGLTNTHSSAANSCVVVWTCLSARVESLERYLTVIAWNKLKQNMQWHFGIDIVLVERNFVTVLHNIK